jgi:hypothetical protein
VKAKGLLLRKRTAIIALVLALTLVATVTAAVYYSLMMQPYVTINAAPVRFVSGGDWSAAAGSLGDNGTYVRLALKAYPNATMIYEDPLNVSNTDTSSRQFRLRHITISPASGAVSVSNFTAINFVVKNAAGTKQGSFNYTTTGDTWNTPATTSYFTVPASTMWILYVETKGAPKANLNVAASIEIAVDVPG